MSKILPTLCLALILSSCVSVKTYRNTKAELLAYQFGQNNLQSEIDSLTERNGELEEECDDLKRQGTASDRTIELERLLAERDEMLAQIKNALNESLEYFQDKGLSLAQRNGKIYVSMEDKLLFESGKYELTGNGEDAISEIVNVLVKIPTVDILVEGHTDDKGLLTKPGAQIIDNWDLSCKRATEVVRLMMQTKGLDPKRITASGRGQYMPLVKNNSDASRAMNRRTEIILTPKLDKVMEIIEK